MALSKILGDQGKTPERINTKATLTMVKTDTGFTFTRVQLDTDGRVPGYRRSRLQTSGGESQRELPDLGFAQARSGSGDVTGEAGKVSRSDA